MTAVEKTTAEATTVYGTQAKRCCLRSDVSARLVVYIIKVTVSVNRNTVAVTNMQ